MARRDAQEPLGGEAATGHVRRAGAGISTSRVAGANQALEARDNSWNSYRRSTETSQEKGLVTRPAPTLFRGRGRKEAVPMADGRPAEP